MNRDINPDIKVGKCLGVFDLWVTTTDWEQGIHCVGDDEGSMWSMVLTPSERAAGQWQVIELIRSQYYGTIPCVEGRLRKKSLESALLRPSRVDPSVSKLKVCRPWKCRTSALHAPVRSQWYVREGAQAVGHRVKQKWKKRWRKRRWRARQSHGKTRKAIEGERGKGVECEVEESVVRTT